jgi:hypothetical protein
MNREEFSDKVNDALNHGIDIYTAILDNSFQHYYCISLDCSKLVDVLEDESVPDGVISHFFSFLHKDDINGFQINKKACLYIFELVSHSAAQIKDVYRTFTDNQNFQYLNKSAMKKNPGTNTKYLYIGKVKRGIGNRMSTHFGYANPQIGALQLRYWGRQIKLQLKVHILAFDEAIDDYINPLELRITKNMNPLIGKSK